VDLSHLVEPLLDLKEAVFDVEQLCQILIINSNIFLQLVQLLDEFTLQILLEYIKLRPGFPEEIIYLVVDVANTHVEVVLLHQLLLIFRW
jgi:hypothetical protein